MRSAVTRVIPVLATAMPRTRSGRWRAVNMMSTAPTKGAHVTIDSTGQPFIGLGGGLRPPSEPPAFALAGGLRPPSEPPPTAGLRRRSRRSNGVRSTLGRSVQLENVQPETAMRGWQTVQEGPDARRRPRAAREAYFLYVERAAEGANEADGPS